MRPVFIGRDTPFEPTLSVADVTYAVRVMSCCLRRDPRQTLGVVGRSGVQAWSCASRGFVAGLGMIGGFHPPRMGGYVTTCLAEMEARWDDDTMRKVLDEMDGNAGTGRG